MSTDFGGSSVTLADLSGWPPPTSRAPTASACEPYRELIEQALARGRNAMAIWQDLVDDHGFPGRYASVRCFVVKLRGQETPEAHPVIVTAPGEEGQVDYGDGAMVRHPLTRRYRRTRLFVFTLGYSRKSALPGPAARAAGPTGRHDHLRARPRPVAGAAPRPRAARPGVTRG